jgi:hypothetical protein
MVSAVLEVQVTSPQHNGLTSKLHLHSRQSTLSNDLPVRPFESVQRDKYTTTTHCRLLSAVFSRQAGLVNPKVASKAARRLATHSFSRLPEGSYDDVCLIIVHVLHQSLHCSTCPTSPTQVDAMQGPSERSKFTRWRRWSYDGVAM